MDASTFEMLDEMAQAIRARLIGRPDEWGAIDEAARISYRLAAADAVKAYTAQQKALARNKCKNWAGICDTLCAACTDD